MFYLLLPTTHTFVNVFPLLLLVGENTTIYIEAYLGGAALHFSELCGGFDPTFALY